MIQKNEFTGQKINNYFYNLSAQHEIKPQKYMILI